VGHVTDNEPAAATPIDALGILDEINASGVLEYPDYVRLHDAITQADLAARQHAIASAHARIADPAFVERAIAAAEAQTASYDPVTFGTGGQRPGRTSESLRRADGSDMSECATRDVLARVEAELFGMDAPAQPAAELDAESAWSESPEPDIVMHEYFMSFGMGYRRTEYDYDDSGASRRFNRHPVFPDRIDGRGYVVVQASSIGRARYLAGTFFRQEYSGLYEDTQMWDDWAKRSGHESAPGAFRRRNGGSLELGVLDESGVTWTAAPGR